MLFLFLGLLLVSFISFVSFSFLFFVFLLLLLLLLPPFDEYYFEWHVVVIIVVVIFVLILDLAFVVAVVFRFVRAFRSCVLAKVCVQRQACGDVSVAIHSACLLSFWWLLVIWVERRKVGLLVRGVYCFLWRGNASTSAHRNVNGSGSGTVCFVVS